MRRQKWTRLEANSRRTKYLLEYTCVRTWRVEATNERGSRVSGRSKGGLTRCDMEVRGETSDCRGQNHPLSAAMRSGFSLGSLIRRRKNIYAEAVVSPGTLKRGENDVAQTLAQVGQAVVTTEGDKVRLPGLLTALQTPGHATRVQGKTHICQNQADVGHRRGGSGCGPPAHFILVRAEGWAADSPPWKTQGPSTPLRSGRDDRLIQ